MPTISRRRMIGITAAAGAGALLGTSLAARPAKPYGWRGTALGANATIRLFHENEAEAVHLVARCRDEIARLERVFSLYLPDSELVRLNRDGRLEAPSHEMIELLSIAARYGHASGGAFDVTVQPLFDLYARHFAGRIDKQSGPPETAIRAARDRVDYRAIRIESGCITLDSPAAAVTLNGIAQGYITDRVADLLRRDGLRHVLVNLGEMRALGPKPDGDAWDIGLASPASETLHVAEGAIATSGGYGTTFESTGRYHHLIDPRTGRSANAWTSVTVAAETATKADALSTGLSVMEFGAASGFLEQAAPARAVFYKGQERRELVA